MARALVKEPRLLLADEPTGNLDAAAADDVVALLLELRRANALTLIVATHNADVAAHADRVMRMRAGQLTVEAVA